ncbi:ATP-binding protein [Catenulispora sp. MAP5-51]|uniref:ATP-binding protein n=1 Tax=Catenulispora sp. MAP5-51 TaxID=3156298 RepID=UPI0035164C6F
MFEAMVNSDFTVLLRGQTFLIHGHEGCGKTSLIHRCAHRLTRDIQSSDLEHIIIDLTTEPVTGYSVEMRLRHVCNRVIDELDMRRVFNGDERSTLASRGDNPSSAYPYLSHLLKDKRKIISILLPSSEISDEVKTYGGLARDHIFFFCESSYPNVALDCSSHAGPASAKPVIQLNVDVLTVDDGWTFTHDRISRSTTPGTPAVNKATIHKFMKARIEGRGRTTIRELQITCLNVFEEAISRRATRVEYADFTEYYARKGLLR